MPVTCLYEVIYNNFASENILTCPNDTLKKLSVWLPEDNILLHFFFARFSSVRVLMCQEIAGPAGRDSQESIDRTTSQSPQRESPPESNPG